MNNSFGTLNTAVLAIYFTGMMLSLFSVVYGIAESVTTC